MLGKNAKFILTGSANPEESAKMHSGAGRFTIVDMRTMSWQELGFSSGKISLAKLFEGGKIDIYDNPTDLEFIIGKLIIGGFPTLLNRNVTKATDLNRAYVELLAEVDMSRQMMPKYIITAIPAVWKWTASCKNTMATGVLLK
jgi:hypothetical protein